MSETSWQDQLAGHRMQVDSEFSSRVRESDLTKSEWNLVMTAVEFDVEGEGEDARLVADTSKVPGIVPEFENLASGGMGGMGGAPSGGSSGGLLDSVKDALGVGGGDEEKLQAATSLAEEYAEELQAHLEEKGRWTSIRRAANQPSPE
ncbi:MAG: DUF5799 family protein [Halobacteriales archaeon]